MSLADVEHEQFKPTDHGGFDVIDITVFDTALQKLEQDVNLHLLSSKRQELILIEFARNNYLRAFQQFSQKFLYDAFFLYLNVDQEVCKKRIRERIANPNTEHDFYVSEYIFSTYYYEDDGRFMSQILVNEHGVEKESVKVIDNNGFLSNSIAEIYQFVDTICG